MSRSTCMIALASMLVATSAGARRRRSSLANPGRVVAPVADGPCAKLAAACEQAQLVYLSVNNPACNDDGCRRLIDAAEAEQTSAVREGGDLRSSHS